MRLLKFQLLLPLFFILSSQCQKESASSGDQAFELALSQAKKENKMLIVQFTADWCPDCKALEKIFLTEQVKGLFQERAILLPVDVGRFDKNFAISQKLGNPIENGIPAVVTILPNEPFQIIASTKGGEFSSARTMSESQVYEYFRKILY